MDIGLMVSGELGLRVFRKLPERFKINFVLTDKNSTSIISLCNAKNIFFYSGNPRNGKAMDKLQGLECDLLVSVNYLFLIEKDLIQMPKKMAVNFHGSILPKYRGRTPHVWAIINNENETGITAHEINEGCDSGNIIAEKKIKLFPTDTGAVIFEKFNEMYPDFVIEVLNSVANDSFISVPQNNSLASYFGKRTPEDGLINWNWQRERIFNWVRAQAKPYPGAFTFCKGKKITIHKIQFSDFGFDNAMANGTVVSLNHGQPIIKTPNGAIELVEFECDCKLEVNTILK